MKPSGREADPRDTAVAVAVAAARLTRAVTARDTTHGEPAAVWRALSILEQYGPMRVGDFAVVDQCTQPTATAMLRRLETEGAVRRSDDPSDRRVALMELTSAGRGRLSGLRRGLADRLGPAVAALSAEDQRKLADSAALIDALLGHLHD